MSKTIAIIPARGGSKRLPGKNIKLLDGIPLIAHSILYAKANHDVISDIYVSTDDEAIKAVALQYGAKVIDRPTKLSGDYEPTVSAVRHVLENIADTIDNVVILQATNPLRPKHLLKEAMTIFHNENCESLFTVTVNLHKLGKISENRFKPFNYEPGQRSQDLDPLYFENGLLYISRAKLIFENKIIGADAFPMVVNDPFATVDIDTEEDFNHAEYLIKNK
jgi:CMP-N-acetylneuraminic acid synthetase